MGIKLLALYVWYNVYFPLNKCFRFLWNLYKLQENSWNCIWIESNMHCICINAIIYENFSFIKFYNGIYFSCYFLHSRLMCLIYSQNNLTMVQGFLTTFLKTNLKCTGLLGLNGIPIYVLDFKALKQVFY